MKQMNQYQNSLYPELLTQFNQFDGFYARFSTFNSPTQHITPKMLFENKLLAIRVSNLGTVHKYASLLDGAYFAEDIERRTDKIHCAYTQSQLQDVAKTIKNQRKDWLNILILPTRLSNDLTSIVQEFDLEPVLVFDEILENIHVDYSCFTI